MNIDKYIVKARPGVVGGKFEEKRPLRERIELPVKRHIFINRDSHPDADIYVAIHEAKDLPPNVPDYQVPHFHNTDEFYYFIGNNPDLTGLEGQIIFEGRVHKIVSPACIYIPTGAVHEYKVTRGAGTVTVLFRNRGYTHEDKQPDLEKGTEKPRSLRVTLSNPTCARPPRSNITPTRHPECAMFSSTASSA
jgi:hypothetical protein